MRIKLVQFPHENIITDIKTIIQYLHEKKILPKMQVVKKKVQNKYGKDIELFVSSLKFIDLKFNFRDQVLVQLDNQKVADSLKNDSEYDGKNFSTTESGLRFHLLKQLCADDERIAIIDYNFDHFQFTDDLSYGPLYWGFGNIDEYLKNDIKMKGLFNIFIFLKIKLYLFFYINILIYMCVF